MDFTKDFTKDFNKDFTMNFAKDFTNDFINHFTDDFIPRREVQKQCPRGSTWQSFRFHMWLASKNWLFKNIILYPIFWTLRKLLLSGWVGDKKGLSNSLIFKCAHSKSGIRGGKKGFMAKYITCPFWPLAQSWCKIWKQDKKVTLDFVLISRVVWCVEYSAIY